ncbi:MAG: hypoxanthine phosphoribosyltransferase [Bdellovibrionaceae bacterium]|nr:hypoxanthine phosphoribosyltransferase [Bdellovibrionales bacterium]MCB9084801.1 hypoxanthine phosphoribosyltransferase [Pseudobdellovibrionaceae bacterium]
MPSQLKLTELISEEALTAKVKEIGKALSDKYHGEDLVAICVLKGSFMFYADLIREIDTDLVSEFFGVSSYMNSSKSSGEVRLTLDLHNPIEGKHVLLVEDIVDTGLTMNYLQKTLGARNPKSLTTAALLLKPSCLKVECKVDYVGFEIPDEFVVGYGLDYQGYFRNIPYIAQVQGLI